MTGAVQGSPHNLPAGGHFHLGKKLRQISLFDETLLMERGFIKTAISYDAEKREVRLFELRREAGEEESASDYLYQLCRLVQLSHFPDLRLSDLRWTYRNGFFSTGIRFRCFSHGVTIMRLSNVLGLKAEGGDEAEYMSGYYNLKSDIRMPARSATYYILWSPVTGSVSYLVRENGLRLPGYTIVFADAAAYAAMLRRKQPLLFQTTPDLMEHVRASGAGSRLSQPLAMTKIVCRGNLDHGTEEIGVLFDPASSLGLIGHNFDVIPVLVRRGAEARLLRRVCGVDLRAYAPEWASQENLMAGGSAA
jgi:hypothetical protein